MKALRRFALAAAALMSLAGGAFAQGSPSVTGIRIVGPDTINARTHFRVKYRVEVLYSDGSTSTPDIVGWERIFRDHVARMDRYVGDGTVIVAGLGYATLTAHYYGPGPFVTMDLVTQKEITVVDGPPAADPLDLDCVGGDAPVGADYGVTTWQMAAGIDILPLCGGKVLYAQTGMNRVQLLDVPAGRVLRDWQLSSTPRRMRRIPGTPYLFVLLDGTVVSRVDLTGGVTPFNIPAVGLDIIAGEPGEVWIGHLVQFQPVPPLSRFDVNTLQQLGTGNAGLIANGPIAYDPVGHMFYSYAMWRYSYAPASGLFTLAQSASGSASWLELSPNRRHLAAGPQDRDPADLTRLLGSWNGAGFTTFRFDSKKILGGNNDFIYVYDVDTHVLEGSWAVMYTCIAPTMKRVGWSTRGRNHFALVDCYQEYPLLIYGALPAPLGLAVATAGPGRGVVASNVGAIACGNDCIDSYAAGTPVTLTATPAAGSLFTGWTGCDSTAGAQCTVTMGSWRSVTAAFTPRHVASDLGFDGRSDLLFQNTDGRISAWMMSGTATSATANLIGAASGWSVTHVADLSGDGKADILFAHSDGRVYAYLMNGLAVTAGKELLGAGLGWSVSHTLDLNGDGKLDLLLRHTDGRAHIWLMDGTGVIGSASLLPAFSGWNVVATGDLNGDGKADIVFMHDDGRGYAYLMDGTTVAAGVGFLSPGSGWTVSHVADLDGDGKGDLLFRHMDGRAHVFLMDGTAFGASAQLLPAGTGWSLTHAGDLNGDGKADLLFKHSDGRAHVRLMDGIAILNAADVLPAGAGWSVTHLLDLNGDGKQDLMLRHANGSIAARLMDGLVTTASATLIGAGTWSVAPPQP